MRRRRGWCRRGGRGAGAAELGGRPPGAAGAGRAWWRWPWPSPRLRGRGVGAVAGIVHRGLRGDRGERAGGGPIEGVARPRVDRKSVVQGKWVSVCLDLGGRRILKTRTHFLVY